MEELTEDERKALRGSKFAPLSSAPSLPRSQPRLAHPGGPMKTNKAAALAKFLERKMQEPSGLSSINPKLVELAVKNAKETIKASGASNSERKIQHVNSFGDSEDTIEAEEETNVESMNHKKKKKIKKRKKQKEREEQKETNVKSTNHKRKKKKDKKKHKKQKIPEASV